MAYNFEAENKLLLNYVPRVAIITGAAQGIGYAIAQQLAKDGIDIAINDLPAKSERIDAVVAEIRALGRRAVSVPADVTDEEQVKQMVEKTVESLGSVDIVSLAPSVVAVCECSEKLVQMIANAGIVDFVSFLDSEQILLFNTKKFP